MTAHFFEVCIERGYGDTLQLIAHANRASVTHCFVLARDDRGKRLVGAHDIAVNKWLVSGCGIKFTPAEWQTEFTQETV
jgi:hypothetical protein